MKKRKRIKKNHQHYYIYQYNNKICSLPFFFLFFSPFFSLLIFCLKISKIRFNVRIFKLSNFLLRVDYNFFPWFHVKNSLHGDVRCDYTNHVIKNTLAEIFLFKRIVFKYISISLKMKQYLARSSDRKSFFLIARKRWKKCGTS